MRFLSISKTPRMAFAYDVFVWLRWSVWRCLGTRPLLLKDTLPADYLAGS